MIKQVAGILERFNLYGNKNEARHGIRTLYSLCFETFTLDLHLFATTYRLTMYSHTK